MQDERKALTPSDAPEIVRQTTVRVLAERIRLLGINRSGAYEHYNLLLAKGFPIPRYEVEILNFVRRHSPSLRSYHEIGSGLGTLPLMLAYDGFASVGVERDDRRHLTALTILKELAVEAPQVDGNCRLLGAAFPDAVADLDVSNSLAILTDFVSSQNPKDYVRLCQALARYRYVLMDLQRFCRKRETTEEQEQLVEELARYGLFPCSFSFDLDSEGHYRLFERGVAQTSQPEQTVETAGADVPLEAMQQDMPRPELANASWPAVSKTNEIVPVSEGEPPATTRSGWPEPLTATVLPPIPQRARSRRFGGLLGLTAFLVIGIPSLLAIGYFGFWASNQYITTFQFAVRGASQAAQGVSAHTAVTGVGAMSPDAFVVTDYINSPQAVSDISRDVDLRTMFSEARIDAWARLGSAGNAEELHRYWTRMVKAHFDLISGNIAVSVRAFTPEDSLRLAQALVATSDEMFRRLNAQAERDAVRLADDNLRSAEARLAKTRETLRLFQEQNNLLNLNQTSLAGSAIIDDLRKQLAGFQAQYATLQKASPKSPMLASLSAQIAATEAQIKSSNLVASTPVQVVTPETLSRYQALELDKQFAEKLYTDALALRNEALAMAQRQQSYLALFVKPKLAEASLYPARLWSIVTVVLAATAAWFIGVLVTYAIRDHLG